MSAVILHPSMTAQQIAEWCATHKCYVEIFYLRRPGGIVECLLLPHREYFPPVATVIPFSPPPQRAS